MPVLNSSSDHVDPGTHADKAKPNLLKGAQVKDLNPYIGTIVKDVQLSQLNKESLDELARYTAERKLLIFRDQDFKDLSPERQIEITRYYLSECIHRLVFDRFLFVSHFGPIHRHPTSGNVKGFPEFHVGE
jgi:sulfonate dioxygenase